MPALSPSHQAALGLGKLSQFALISATGSDAITFLHSQLTNDIKLLSRDHACLAGYCTPKGRLLASMLAIKVGHEAGEEAILLQVPAELRETLQKRLKMFVMRSKVTLTDLAASHTILGILGESTAQQLSNWFPTLPSLSYAAVSNDFGHLLRLPDANGVARYQWIISNDLLEQHWSSLSMLSGQFTEAAWNLSEIHAGIPHITLATQEKFVPQMINYELIGGVNFKKGCYPGQEIVARSQYLGKQKRRMVLAQINSTSVQNGTEVFAASDLTQPCGMVVNAQANDLGGSDCLIEIKTAFLAQDTVQTLDGAVCHWLPMPYQLPDDASADSSNAASPIPSV